MRAPIGPPVRDVVPATVRCAPETDCATTRTTVPHSGQNRALADTGEPHDGQDTTATGVPHCSQNFPAACAPQAGQVGVAAEVSVIDAT